MKNLLTLLFLFAFSSFSFSQSNNVTFSVYFESNSSALSSEAKTRLDSAVQVLSNAAEYAVELTAHTDLQGDETYNMRLSQKREKTVFNYLASAGVNTSFINASHHGEQDPVTEDEVTEDVLENRRVEITLTYWYLGDAAAVLEYAGLNNEQHFHFEGNSEQEVRGEKGTLLTVPRDAFQTKDGMPVPNNEVDFVLEEFPGIGEAVTHQLSTMADGRILESGGMFRMEAYYKGEQLELREGKEINVQLPSTNLQPGMSVFMGQRNDSGVVEWEQTSKSFKVADTTEMPKLPLPGYGDFLRSLRLEVSTPPKYTPMVFDRVMPVIPTSPTMPRKPVEPLAPKEPENKKGAWNELVSKEWRAYKQELRKYNQKMELYNKRAAQYDKQLALYTQRYEQYQQDSTQYVTDLTEWKAKLVAMEAERIQLYQEYKAAYYSQRLNQSLMAVARKMDDSSFYKSNIPLAITSRADWVVEHQNYLNMTRLLAELRFLGLLQSENFHRYKKYVMVKGEVSYASFVRNDKMRRFDKEYSACYGAINLAKLLDQSQPLWDSNTVATLNNMSAFIASEKNRLGIFDRSDAGNMYEASIGGMGYINCDRFSNYSPKQMAGVKLNTPAESKVFVVIPRLNSVIPVYQGHNLTGNLSLPIGEEIKVVTVGAYNGKPTLDIKILKVQPTNNIVKLQPKLVSLQTLREQLNGLKG